MSRSGMTRRQFLAGVGGTAGVTLLAPVVARAHPAFGQTRPDPARAAANRLVVVFLDGGNDGLNTVAPRGDVSGAPRLSVYRKVRPSIAHSPTSLLALDRPGDADHQLGLHPSLSTVHRLYRDGRVAVVQGVDYPKHNYSHFTSTDIWFSGFPDRSPGSGWVGRHLDRHPPGEGELGAVALATGLPLILRGERAGGATIRSVAATTFVDARHPAAGARHAALAAYGRFGADDPLRRAVGRAEAQTVDVVNALHGEGAPAVPHAGEALADGLLTARLLLEQPFGVGTVFVSQPGYDNHVNERADHTKLLSGLDAGFEAFFLGTFRGKDLGIGALGPALASRTLVMVISEFGRRIGENGTGAVAGTDHGAAAPMLLLGPADALVGGVHGDHPAMGTVAAPKDNLEMTTDLRRLYQTVLEGWFSSPDPYYDKLGALPGIIRAPAASRVAADAPKTGASAPTPPAVGAAGQGAQAQGGDAARVSSGRGARERAGRVVIGRDAGGSGGAHPVTAGAALALQALAVAWLARSGQRQRIAQVFRAEPPPG